MSHAIAWQRRYYSVLNQLEDRHAACVATTNLMLVPGMVAIAADITGIIFISFSGIPVLDHIARAGTVWLGASLLMVFIFQPILMSYLPAPRHTRNFERNRDLARRLEALVDRIVEVPVTAGVTRKLLFSGAVGLLVLGVVSALNIQVGYNHPGTPLYRPDAQVNIDAGAIGAEVPGRRGLGDVHHAAVSPYPVGAGAQRVAAGRQSAGLPAERSVGDAGHLVRLHGNQPVQPDVPLRPSQVLRDAQEPTAGG